MKNNSIKKFVHSAKICTIRFSIFNFLLLFATCVKVKHIDIEGADFPPKLSVTAFLDSENGVFDLTIMEGHSLAFYGQGFSLSREIICNGEIRLYENGALVYSVSEPFDLSVEEYHTKQNGYHHIINGIDTHPGSEYRIEVDVEGYPMAVSTSVMPSALVVSASLDTSIQLNMKDITEINSVNYGLRDFGNSNSWTSGKFWAFSAHVSDPNPNVPNFYVFDLFYRYENTHHESGYYNWGIGVPDLMILKDVDMDPTFAMSGTSSHSDLYLFSMLLLGDITFSLENVARTFYASVAQIKNNQSVDDSFLDDHPDYEKITTHHTLFLRIKHITPATYRYYRSLRQQESQILIIGEPVNIVSNIENGFGSFAVYNTTSIPLLEWETFEYRQKAKSAVSYFSYK